MEEERGDIKKFGWRAKDCGVLDFNEEKGEN